MYKYNPEYNFKLLKSAFGTKPTLLDNFFHYARYGKCGPRDVKLKLYPAGTSFKVGRENGKNVSRFCFALVATEHMIELAAS